MDLLRHPQGQITYLSLLWKVYPAGTPVVGYAVGGIPEIIDHKKSGFLAKPFDCTDFADGINWIYNLDSVVKKNVCQNARKKLWTSTRSKHKPQVTSNL